MLCGQYRLMIRTERAKARERKKYDAIEPYRYTDDEIAGIEEQYAAERPRGAEPAGGRTSARATRSARW